MSGRAKSCIDCMGQPDFIHNVLKHFERITALSEYLAKGEIEEKRICRDAASFFDWLKEERQAAKNDPALRLFHLGKTADIAANEIAGKINFELEPNVDWGEQWNSARPLLQNIKPERSDGWRYKQFVTGYINAFRARARARVFAQHIEQYRQELTTAPAMTPAQEEPQRKGKPTKKGITVSFEDLFLGEPEEAKKTNISMAENAAQKTGLISFSDGKIVWEKGERGKRLIIVFWFALREKRLVFGHIKPVDACKAIAEKFNAGGIATSTVYQHLDNKRKAFFDKDGDLKEWHDAILAELNRM